jgi:hypothetical protein
MSVVKFKDNIPTELTNRATLVGDDDDDTRIMINYLCTLPSLMAWPSVLFEIIGEYCRDIPPVCYIFGGFDGNREAVATCGRLVDGEWFELPSMNMSRNSCGVCHIGEYIYITGGQGQYSTTLVTVDQLHVPTLKWSSGSPLPEPRTLHGCVAVDGDMYVIGGVDHGREDCNSMYRYESKSRVWTIAPSMKRARNSGTYVVLDKRIYALGGKGTISCEMFDIESNRWSDIASLSHPRYLACAVKVEDNNILLIGGADIYGKSLNVIDEYNPISNSWRRLSLTLPCPRKNVTSWYDFGSKSLYIAFGLPTLACNNVYMRHHPADTGEWVLVKECRPRFGFGWTILCE